MFPVINEANATIAVVVVETLQVCVDNNKGAHLGLRISYITGTDYTVQYI